MKPQARASSTLVATVDQVMPRTGLAYVVGEDGTEWTLTKSTKGTGFATLEPGQSVHLVLDRHDRFSLVAEYFSQPQATRPS